jgi:hypothetical protein
MPNTTWGIRRETSLNWLALGLLLAAWNTADNDPTGKTGPAGARRPEALRGYDYVSVRAVQRSSRYPREAGI